MESLGANFCAILPTFAKEISLGAFSVEAAGAAAGAGGGRVGVGVGGVGGGAIILGEDCTTDDALRTAPNIEAVELTEPEAPAPAPLELELILLPDGAVEPDAPVTLARFTEEPNIDAFELTEPEAASTLLPIEDTSGADGSVEPDALLRLGRFTEEPNIDAFEFTEPDDISSVCFSGDLCCCRLDGVGVGAEAPTVSIPDPTRKPLGLNSRA